MRRTALALIVLALPAFAKDGGNLRIDPAAPATQATAEGYKGVAPGGQALPPHPPKLPIKGPQRMTWSGFQVKDGVPTVFLELTAPPDYQIENEKGAVVVTLKNTVVPLKNNRRPLRVGAFETNVTDVETRQRGRDTQVVIHVKDAAPHREHVEAAAGGFQMLVIELPAAK